jgi:hypothetical protein
MKQLATISAGCIIAAPCSSASRARSIPQSIHEASNGQVPGGRRRPGPPGGALAVQLTRGTPHPAGSSPAARGADQGGPPQPRPQGFRDGEHQRQRATIANQARQHRMWVLGACAARPAGCHQQPQHKPALQTRPAAASPSRAWAAPALRWRCGAPRWVGHLGQLILAHAGQEHLRSLRLFAFRCVCGGGGGGGGQEAAGDAAAGSSAARQPLERLYTVSTPPPPPPRSPHGSPYQLPLLRARAAAGARLCTCSGGPAPWHGRRQRPEVERMPSGHRAAPGAARRPRRARPLRVRLYVAGACCASAPSPAPCPPPRSCAPRRPARNFHITQHMRHPSRRHPSRPMYTATRSSYYSSEVEDGHCTRATRARAESCAGGCCSVQPNSFGCALQPNAMRNHAHAHARSPQVQLPLTHSCCDRSRPPDALDSNPPFQKRQKRRKGPQDSGCGPCWLLLSGSSHTDSPLGDFHPPTHPAPPRSRPAPRHLRQQ